MEEDFIDRNDIDRLSNSDKLELNNFIKAAEQKAGVQGKIHQMTETCFKKCIPGSISSGKLASKEESCMANCVNRMFDSNLTILKHLETLRGQQ